MLNDGCTSVMISFLFAEIFEDKSPTETMYADLLYLHNSVIKLSYVKKKY